MKYRQLVKEMSLYSVGQEVTSLDESWEGGASWLKDAAAEVNKLSREVRDDIRDNTNSWSYPEYCERLAYYYYNIASCYNELFCNNKVDLESVIRYLQKCLEKLEEHREGNVSDETRKMKSDAAGYLTKLQEIYERKIEKLKARNVSNGTKNLYCAKQCVYLGCVTEGKGFLQQGIECVLENDRQLLKKQLLSIQVLRIITTLEDPLTTPEQKDSIITAQQCYYLSKVYYLTGNFSLGKRYEKTAQHLFLSCETSENYHADKRHHRPIEEIVRTSVKEHKSTLQQVKDFIEEMYGMPLSNVDLAYTERNYIKCCLNVWLQEAVDFSRELTETKRYDIIQDIFKSLDTISDFGEIPSPLNTFVHYKLLMAHHRLVSKEDKVIFLSKFKKQYLEQLVTIGELAKKELAFLKAFLDFLSTSKNSQLIIAELQLKKFCNGSLLFEEFLSGIMELKVDNYGQSLAALQKALECLQKENNLFLVDKFKEILSGYINPVEIKEKKLDGRLIIEVIGKNIVVSEILRQVERELLRNSSIVEVCFVGGDTIHIDAHLKNEVWHGKNIVVYTKIIKIYDKVTWDVSGMDNNHVYTNDAGTTGDGQGKPGADGFAGESGGNVLVLTEEIENPEYFSIISHGGKGSQGQDGGNGKDGDAGKGITASEFREKFPPTASVLSRSRFYALDSTIKNIRENLSQVITEWDKNISERRSMLYRDFYLYGLPLHLRVHVYINAIMNDGSEIIFSFGDSFVFSISQSFLLYKGSEGKPGERGGEYGWGGQGGYPGDILVRNPRNISQQFSVVKSTKPGEEGSRGKRGLYGHHGENGWDMGYMDCESITGEWPKMFGTNEKSKLTLKFYEDYSSKRIWCPYKEHNGETKQYAEITASIIEHKKERKYEETQNTKQKDDRRPHARATKKKIISQRSVLGRYSNHFSSMEKHTLQELQTDLEATIQHALQAVTETHELQKQATELGIKRIGILPHKSVKKQYTLLPNCTSRATVEQNVTSVIGILDREQPVLDNWFRLTSTQLNRSQLHQLFSIFTRLKNGFSKRESLERNTEHDKLQSIEEILIEKYRFAMLQEIASKLPSDQNISKNVQVKTLRSAEKYLFEDKQNQSNFSHAILGNLSQYFIANNQEQREKICKFCKEELLKSDNETFKSSIKRFVLEAGMSVEVETDIREDRQHVLEHDESGSVPLTESLTNLDNECRENKTIFAEYIIYIEERGPMSETCRDLLSQVYDVNIRLYVVNQYNQLVLRDDHNSSSRQIYHILYKGNTFTQLTINKDYVRLGEKRKRQVILFERILAETQQFKHKQEFDDYLEKENFSPDTNHLENEVSSLSLYDKHHLSEEQVVSDITEYFSAEEEKQELKPRLEKLMSQYIGEQGILQNILKRFSNEGRQVSSLELYCLITSILISDKEELNIFRWIVAAYPQRSWIDELTLIQLENYFQKSLEEIPKWRKYLLKIENKDIVLYLQVRLDQHKSSVTTHCIDETLRLLSNIPNITVSLEGLELSEWPYALKENYWTCKLSQLGLWKDNEELSTVSYYLQSIENKFGPTLAEKFMMILEKEKLKLSPDTLTEILSSFHKSEWNLNEEVLNILDGCDTTKWKNKMQQEFSASDLDRDITQLVSMIKDNANTSTRVLDKLPTIKECVVGTHMCRLEGASETKLVSCFKETDITHWAKAFKLPKSTDKEQDIKEMLAVIIRAIELKKGFKLRDAQKLSVMSLLLNDHNTLAQVSTGEGKSLIVVAASIMKALCGEKVDIITSSSVLAKRDAEDNADIYNLFDIDVSHNCSEDIEKRKEAYSCNQVVYGELSHFQRDYLLDQFYGKNILGDRNFENVVIDEVDSMLLDKGNNMLYLSHDLPGFDKLASVYIYIWQWINRPARGHEDLLYTFDTEAIKEAVMHDLYGLIKKEDIKSLSSDLKEHQIDAIWECLIDAKVLDNYGTLKDDINDIQFNQVLSPELMRYKEGLDYLVQECIKRKKHIHVPNCLRAFVRQHLDAWIKNAINAFFMTPGQDYVVDVDRTGTSPDRKPNITILDKSTGADQANSQWDEALHQFIQLKHGCKLSLQSLKAVFISNVSFFKLYRNLYGLTGTLGSQREKELLQTIHRVDFVIIPTAKPRQFYEDKPILCTGEGEWISHILNETKKITEEKQRSVLIICETVNDVETLYKAFRGKQVKHVHTYTRDYERFDVAQGSRFLEQRQIIIATNLAGRGTDIRITDQLRKAGGLHVCLTYLPNNIRIEEQAFGRAARKGDKGYGQLILVNSKGQSNSHSKIFDLRKERDAEDLHRISDTIAHYETEITVEENCLKAFKQQYQQLKRNLDSYEVPAAAKEILLQSCLDKWALWLDTNSKHITALKNKKDTRNVKDKLDTFISQLKNLESNNWQKWFAWVDKHPTLMIKLGKYFTQDQKPDNAIKLFNAVIKQEQHFSEAAHYYKAIALATKIDWEQQTTDNRVKDKKLIITVEEELRTAARLFDKHSECSMHSAAVIGKIKKTNKESIIQIDGFEEQQRSLLKLYKVFSNSINDIVGHFVTPHSFISNGINEELADILYDDLLRESILKKPKLKQNFSEEELKCVSFSYGISFEALNTFLSLNNGKEIDKNKFLKSLKGLLPSREGFWKLLIEQKALTGEIKYTLVDNDKLKEIDPSLLDFLVANKRDKKLKERTLECSNEQILLNTEQVSQQENGFCVFETNDFKNTVGKDKYKVLKEKGVLLFNRKANIDNSKINSIYLASYDSITLEDFTKVNITKGEADKLLQELVKQQFIERNNGSENGVHGLKINFNEIEQLQLHSCPVYENAVKVLLSACFAYRIALQRIVRQLEEKTFPVRLKLMCKPHLSLFTDLLERNVIRTPKVAATAELETSLMTMYKQTMGKNNFKLLLSGSKLIPKECTETLFHHLVNKKWISNSNAIQIIQDVGMNIGMSLINDNPIQTIQDVGMNVIKETIQEVGMSVIKETIQEVGMSVIKGNEILTATQQASMNVIHKQVTDRYFINDVGKRQTPLSFSPLTSHNGKISGRINIDKTVENILNNRLQLSNEDIITNMLRTLKKLKGSLKTKTVPNYTLKPLTEFCGGKYEFANIQEVHVFYLNGLDQVLQIEEKKWTKGMLWNTGFMIAMGVCQIAIGTVIKLMSNGAMTFVGNAFISEGVSDLLFAVSAYRSGYFSWKDYRKHKLMSLWQTSVTVGVGAYFSKGTRVSSFGHKLYGPRAAYQSKFLAETCGTRLIEAAGWKKVVTEVGKHIVMSATRGLVFGLVHEGVNELVDNYLQSLCSQVGSIILSDIEREVEGHIISTRLEELYMTLGEERSKEVVDDITNTLIHKQSYVEECVCTTSRILSSITAGIAAAVDKRSYTNNKLEWPIHSIIKVIGLAEHSFHVVNIRMITSQLLNNVDQKMQYTLSNERKQSVRRTLPHQSPEAVKCYKKEIIDKWKLFLREKAKQAIARHIVSPILQEGANVLLDYVGRKVKEVYESHKETSDLKELEKLKKQYHHSIESLSEQERETHTIVEHLEKKYHEAVLKLISNTRSPEVVAAANREIIPMDLICVSACSSLIQRISSEPVTIIIEVEGGLSQTFPSSQEGVEGKIVKLILKDNHYQLYGVGTLEENTRSGSTNDCLFKALSQVVPELQALGPGKFRSLVADHIQKDPDIRHRIQQGWHRLPLSSGVFGGRESRKPEPGVNTAAEKLRPSQDGPWKFLNDRDVDLRKVQPLSIEEYNDQIVQAFNVGHRKINECLALQTKSTDVVKVENYTATLYDLIFVTGPNGELEKRFYPVEFETDVKILGKNRKEMNFTVKMNLDNPAADDNGPRCPHVGYEIIGKKQETRQTGEKKGFTFVGHILINDMHKPLTDPPNRQYKLTIPDRGRGVQVTSDNPIPCIPVSALFNKEGRPNEPLARIDSVAFGNKIYLTPTLRADIVQYYRDYSLP